MHGLAPNTAASAPKERVQSGRLVRQARVVEFWQAFKMQMSADLVDRCVSPHSSRAVELKKRPRRKVPVLLALEVEVEIQLLRLQRHTNQSKGDRNWQLWHWKQLGALGTKESAAMRRSQSYLLNAPQSKAAWAWHLCEQGLVGVEERPACLHERYVCITLEVGHRCFLRQAHAKMSANYTCAA